MIYLVACDLHNGDPARYDEVTKAIHGHFDNFVQAMNHIWFVDSADGERAVADRIAGVLKPEDHLFVCELTQEHYGLIRPDAATWLLNHSIYFRKT